MGPLFNRIFNSMKQLFVKGQGQDKPEEKKLVDQFGNPIESNIRPKSLQDDGKPPINMEPSESDIPEDAKDS